MEKEIKINSVIDTAMKNLNSIVDVNTVVGKSIKSDNGAIIIPISKVTFGFMTGGGEYGEVKLFKKSGEMPFAGGSGAIVSIKPSGFLVEENGKFKLITQTEDSYEKIIDTATDIINSLKN